MKKPATSLLASLLEKHALGICTPEENTLLEQWYAAFPEKEKIWHSEEEKAEMKNGLKAAIFNEIAPAKVRPMRLRNSWWKVAAAVLLLTGGLLLYKAFNINKAPEYITVSAPVGKDIVTYQLPDRSVIWLEPGTTLKYRKDFTKKDDREILLTDGMAFFSVTKDALHPFVVRTPNGVQTKVLGTEFTVKAYPQGNDVQVMVTSGVVQVSDAARILDTLRAGEQLHYQVKEHTSKRITSLQQDWRTGIFVLNNAPFAEVVHLLEKHYGLKVNYRAEEMTHYRFTIEISKKTTAVELLEMLKEIGLLQCELKRGQVTITTL